MENRKTDEYYVEKMKKDITFVISHTDNISLDDFEKDEVLQDSMMFRLIQISENAKKLSDAYKSQHGNIPWRAVYGLRNRIVHEYGHVDLATVFQTLKVDIPNLLQQLTN